MAWDKESRKGIELLAKVPDSSYSMREPELVYDKTSDENIAKKLKKTANILYLYSVFDAVNKTSEKFQEVLEEPNPEKKIEILSSPCGICYLYNGKHEDCLYESRCKTRRNGPFFHGRN